MTSSSTPARPRQLTLAAWFVVGGSLFVLASAFDSYSKVESVDTRDQVAQAIQRPAGQGLGVSVAEAVDALRVGLMVLAVCAVVAAVAGFFVLQRHRGARLVLAVLALPLAVLSVLTGDLMGALVAVAIGATWSGQARDWFAGRPVRDAPPGLFGPRPPSPGGRDAGAGGDAPRPPAGPPAPRPVASGPSPSVSRPSGTPGATQGFGTPPEERPDRPQDPSAWPAPAWRGAAYPTRSGEAGRRPYVVSVACVLTWIFAGLVAVVVLAFLVALALDPSPFVDQITGLPEWERLGFSDDVLVPALVLDGLLFLLWSLGACVLAWFVWRRHNWARYLLVASAAVALLAGLFAFPVGMLHQLACALTIGALLGRVSREWFSRSRSSGPGGPAGPGGPGAGPRPDRSYESPDPHPQEQPPTVGGGRQRPW